MIVLVVVLVLTKYQVGKSISECIIIVPRLSRGFWGVGGLIQIVDDVRQIVDGC